MGQKIVNVQNRAINACASFSYRGYTISVSTIFHPERPEVIVFGDTWERKFDSVEEAIDFCRYA